jgi:hypothetical protein
MKRFFRDDIDYKTAIHDGRDYCELPETGKNG